MKFFNMFKNNKETNTTEYGNTTKQSSIPHDISYSRENNGNIKIDFLDYNADFKQLYDSTRLVIGNPKVIKNKLVYDCLVSWYNYSDAEYIGQIDSRTDYKHVLAELDISLLFTDENYCRAVMTNLLNQKSVEKYIACGLEEHPETPCGEYIGGIMLKDNSYKKYFDTVVGAEAHFSKEMIQKRATYKLQQEQKRQDRINSRKAMIQKLQEEIDEIER